MKHQKSQRHTDSKGQQETDDDLFQGDEGVMDEERLLQGQRPSDLTWSRKDITGNSRIPDSELPEK